MVKTSSPPADSLPKTALKQALPLVEIQGYVAQAYELCRYWLDDDNLVYSATLHIFSFSPEVILFRENVSGVELVRDCEEAIATGTVKVKGTQGNLEDIDGKACQYINATEWAPACPE